jgi:hypothetical protein
VHAWLQPRSHERAAGAIGIIRKRKSDTAAFIRRKPTLPKFNPPQANAALNEHLS